MILRQLSSASSRLHQCPFTSAYRTRGALAAHPPWWRGHGCPGLCANLLVSSGCSLHSSCCLLMERPRRDKEPPHKRRKSTEERASDDARTRHQEAAAVRTDPDTDKKSSSHRSSGSGQSSRGSRETRENGSGKRQERNSSKERSRTVDPPRLTSAWSRSQAFRSTSDLRPTHVALREGGPPPRPPKESFGNTCHGPVQPVHSARPSNPWWVSTRRPAPAGLVPPPRLPSPPVTQLRRCWETCGSNPRPPGGRAVFDFSVLSYNILSQQLLQDNAYLYRHCPPDVLSWDYRLPNLLAEIQQLDADVLCLQEVQEDHYHDQIRPALGARGFQCEFKKRTGSKPDGCAVAFRTSRLALVSSTPVEFYRPGDALLDRDNVGLVLLLRPSSLGSDAPPLCVANTHLLYNPRRGDVKLGQLAVLLAEIRRLSRLPDGSLCPVVLCGDLNSTPWSPLYAFLTTGRLQYQGLEISMVSGQENSSRGQRLLQSPIWSHSLGINQKCQYQNHPTVEDAVSDLSVDDPPTDRWTIEHGIKLRSSYRHRLLPDGRPEITTFHARTAMTVDYILYSPECSSSLSGRGLQLLGRLSLVGWPELDAVSGLPNQRHSSDHLPLLARFRL